MSQNQQQNESPLCLGPVRSPGVRRVWLSSSDRILSYLNHLDHADWLWFRANHLACIFDSSSPFINLVKIQGKIKHIGLNFVPLFNSVFSLHLWRWSPLISVISWGGGSCMALISTQGGVNGTVKADQEDNATLRVHTCSSPALYPGTQPSRFSETMN